VLSLPHYVSIFKHLLLQDKKKERERERERDILYAWATLSIILIIYRKEGNLSCGIALSHFFSTNL